jgi:hypothetical protein
VLISTATFTRENGSVGTLGNAALAYKPGQGNAGEAWTDIGRDDRFFTPDQLIPDDSEIDFGIIAGEASASAANDALTAVERAVEILRGSQPGNGLLLAQFELPTNSSNAGNIFDHFEQLGVPLPETINIGDEATTVQPADEGDPAPTTQDLPITSRLAAIADALPVAVDSAPRLLAIIAQDMASFGARSGEDELAWRRDGVVPLDYFA